MILAIIGNNSRYWPLSHQCKATYVYIYIYTHVCMLQLIDETKQVTRLLHALLILSAVRLLLMQIFRQLIKGSTGTASVASCSHLSS